MCMECYIDEKRMTPLLNPIECLQNHTQYICGTNKGGTRNLISYKAGNAVFIRRKRIL